MIATGRAWGQAIASWETRPRAQEILNHLELDRAALAKRLATDEPIELLHVMDLDGHDPEHYLRSGWDLVAAMAARALPAWTPAHERHEGDLEIDGDAVKIVEGDLHVTGNLRIHGRLVVVGDVTVGGWQKDRYVDIARIVIAGKLTAGDHLFSEGFLRVGGRVSAPLVVLSFNQGFATFLDGCETRAFVEGDHGGTRVMGELRAPWIVRDEAELDADPAETDAAGVLRPEVAKQIHDEDLRPMRITELLVDLLDAGKPIFPTR